MSVANTPAIVENLAASVDQPSLVVPGAAESKGGNLTNGHAPNLSSSLSPSSSTDVKPDISAQRQDSTWSSVFETSGDNAQSTSNYDVLPSSPESGVSNLPLLHTTTSADSAEEQRSTN